MKNKAGRPPLPEGTPKEIVYSSKLSGNKSMKAEQEMERNEESKSAFVRDAIEKKIEGPPIWVKSKWKRTELDGQFIEFSLKAKVPLGIRVLEGIGKMAVRENSRGEIAIDIFITQYETPYQAVQTRIWLAQDAVDRIELNPKPEPAKFRLVG